MCWSMLRKPLKVKIAGVWTEQKKLNMPNLQFSHFGDLMVSSFSYWCLEDMCDSLCYWLHVTVKADSHTMISNFGGGVFPLRTFFFLWPSQKSCFLRLLITWISLALCRKKTLNKLMCPLVLVVPMTQQRDQNVQTEHKSCWERIFWYNPLTLERIMVLMWHLRYMRKNCNNRRQMTLKFVTYCKCACI